MDEAILDGDRLSLEAHMAKPGFKAGIEEGRWKVLGGTFPDLYVRIFGKDHFSGSICTMDFRLLCDGFPVTAPFVENWNMETKCRPEPPSADRAPVGVVDALKTWNENGVGYAGVYRPWQRYAAMHNGWAQLRPDLAWHRHRELSFIMEQLYDLASEQAAWDALRAA